MQTTLVLPMVLALITDMVSIYIVTSVSFAAVSYYGTALNNVAASPCGVRPRLTSVSFTTVDYNGSASYRNINTANGVQPFIFGEFRLCVLLWQYPQRRRSHHTWCPSRFRRVLLLCFSMVMPEAPMHSATPRLVFI